ncbi:MAG: hypothetical protein AABZ09_06585, partial [Candidatus Binatota bacterium]
MAWGFLTFWRASYRQLLGELLCFILLCLGGEVMDLTEDDVLEILNLIEKSSFDFLQLQMGDL